MFSVASNFGALFVGFVTASVASRWLTPSEIGLYVVAVAVIGVLDAIRGIGVDQYLVQADKVDHRQLRTATGVSLAITVLIVLAMFAGSNAIAQMYSAPELSGILRMLIFAFFLTSIYAPGMAMMQRELRFDVLMLLRLASTIANMVVSLGLIWLGWGVSGLVYGMLASRVAEMLVVFLAGRRFFAMPSLQGGRHVLDFGYKILIARLANSLGSNFADLVIGSMLGLGHAAHYNRASQLTALYRKGIDAAITPVALSSFAGSRREKRDLKLAYLHGLSMMTVVAWPAYAFLALFARPLVSVIYGPGWEQSVPVAQLLALGGAVFVLSALSGPLLTALGQVGAVARRELYVQPARILILLIAAPYGLAAVAVATIVTYALASTVNQMAVRRYAGVRIGDLATALAPSLGVAVMTSAILLLASLLAAYLALGPILQIALGLLAGALGWLASITVQRHPIADELKGILRALRR